ncbi:hypothetical protein NA57DRAFT_36343 [Rhizodiscina lignyota]|uniref:Uncharacterized protein n=1 Tax=Rhizodiscina lignyota TaxID=1504668 RepID=A0A9P4MCP0_9PEZI|nr:hypothetical protein NA57DRAFT_36343 [Rhizodiscina lignyota]
MAIDLHLHQRGLPLTEDDELPAYELPDYEASELPTYERSSISIPTINIQFRQINRSLICLQSVDEDQHLRYKIITKSRTRIFSGKPDMTLYVDSASQDMLVGAFEFDNSTTLPWCPRANLSIDVAGEGNRKVQMESRNFSDWSFTWNDARFIWTLQERPTSLVLVDRSSRTIIARFSYSIYGTTANKGAEIGDLTIYAPSEHGLTTEMVICSCTIAIKHWSKMGRHHRKDLCVSGRYSYGSGVTLAVGYSGVAYT